MSHRPTLNSLSVTNINGMKRILHSLASRLLLGGNRSVGFVLAYDNQQYMVKYEPHHRLRRCAILPKRNPKRKPEKELKRKFKKTRGGERKKVLATRKTETRADIKKAKSDFLKKIIAA